MTTFVMILAAFALVLGVIAVSLSSERVTPTEQADENPPAPETDTDSPTDEPVPVIPTSHNTSAAQSSQGGSWGSIIRTLIVLLLLGGLLFAGYHYRWDEWASRQADAFAHYMTKHTLVIRPPVETVSRPTAVNVRFKTSQPEEGDTVEFDMFWNTQAHHIPPVFSRRELGMQTTWSCAQLAPGQTDHGVTDSPFTWNNRTLSFTPEFRALLDRDEPVRVQLRLTHTALGAQNPCSDIWRG